MIYTPYIRTLIIYLVRIQQVFPFLLPGVEHATPTAVTYCCHLLRIDVDSIQYLVVQYERTGSLYCYWCY